jgi:hypothetical protein
MKKKLDQVADAMSDREIADLHPDIEGWGIDANPQNNPTYPMKHYTGADHRRLNYPRHPQQSQQVEILKSNERPYVTSVFGTSTPPSGLSGMLRRYAFKFSEGSAGHWLTLLVADRVNVVEGIVDDLAHGTIPNIFKERGWTAEWKYNRKGAIRSLAIGVSVTAAIITIIALNRRSKRDLKQAY